MSMKQANKNIRCRVHSCNYHCEDQDFCSLSSIQVEPCANCHDGKAADAEEKSEKKTAKK